MDRKLPMSAVLGNEVLLNSGQTGKDMILTWTFFLIVCEKKLE